MRIDHAALFCKDLEQMCQFFIDYFDARSNEQYHNPRTGLVRVCEEHKFPAAMRPDVILHVGNNCFPMEMSVWLIRGLIMSPYFIKKCSSN
ncbi:MAG: hypothetical protein IJJ56_04475 [Prevotella sp.]|nr:hypothetical protein [Prevotella sp.]